MIKSTVKAIRAHLLSIEDGATTSELSQALGVHRDSIWRSLKNSMPDAYIDRWNRVPRGRGRSKYEAVWDVVRVPPDCPKPNEKVKS